ncbi:uncharacterized protein [Epargyreus clarus]|uniref:uncharacterized protein n=1 Tax=Epargyreus clarus TaxID=520877 RepID=UPI003C30468B
MPSHAKRSLGSPTERNRNSLNVLPNPAPPRLAQALSTLYAVYDAATRTRHTLEECPAWDSQRRVLVAAVGPDLLLLAFVKAIVESERSWKKVKSFYEDVILQKEAAEREREKSSKLPIRSRKTGRRRRAPHAHFLPP